VSTPVNIYIKTGYEYFRGGTMAKRSFISGAIILMLAGFVVRIFGFIYRIYLSNLIGAEGMGVYELIFPIYSLIILTLTSGISVAVSKMVAEEVARNYWSNLRKITGSALVIVVAAGVVVSAIIFFFMDFISNDILKDGRTYYSLMVLVLSIPFIVAASAIKGYFYGIQNVTPTAVSQVVEQVVKIALVMGLAAYVADKGLEYACALATAGMAAGEISNLVLLYIVYFFKRKMNNGKFASRAGSLRKRVVVRNMLAIAVPVSFNRFVTSVMTAIEQILIPRRLLAGGLDYQSSIEEFGRLSGMAMPLILFPSLVTTSLATTLVPAISEAISLKDYRSVNYRISKSIQLTFVMGFIFTALFFTFPNQIGNLLYKRENIGPMLHDLAYLCIFIYLQQTMLGILNGLGRQGVSLRNSMIGSAIRIGFVYFAVPVYGIHGYVIGAAASALVVCVLNIRIIMKTTGMVMDFRNWIIKPGFVGILMFLTGKYIYSFFEMFHMGYTITLISSVIGYVAAALALMFAFGALDKDEVMKMFKKSPKSYHLKIR